MIVLNNLKIKQNYFQYGKNGDMNQKYLKQPENML